jgi:hypothetical protein
MTGPCPCECNSGGFCGGCGHAGCGGLRENLIGSTMTADGRDWTVVAIVGTVHPEILVRLTGTDGNAFAVLAAVAKALTRAGVVYEEVAEFRAEAMTCDYDNVIQTAMRWVTCS